MWMRAAQHRIVAGWLIAGLLGVIPTFTYAQNPEPPALASVALARAVASGGTALTGTVTLKGTAPPGGVLVTLRSSAIAAAAVPPGALIAPGATTATFPIAAQAVAAPSPVTILASLAGESRTAALTVVPLGVVALTLAQDSVVAGFLYRGFSPSGTVTLTGPAPPGGATVTLSGSPANLLSLPVTVAVPAGETAAVFYFDASSAGALSAPVQATISAAYAGVTQTATVTVRPLIQPGVEVLPTVVTGGARSPSATGTVTLSAPSPSDYPVEVSGGGPILGFPFTVVIPAGQRSVSFPVESQVVSVTTYATVSVQQIRGISFASVVVVPHNLVGFDVSPASVRGGGSSTGTIVLDAPAPAGGLTVALSSSSAGASVPASVTVAAGATTATFPIPTQAVSAPTPVTVTASLRGLTRTVPLTVLAPTGQDLSLAPASVRGGTSPAGWISLDSPAPAGGLVVPLTSSATAVASVPASITVAEGATTATFAIATQAVSAPTPVTIGATIRGAVRTATLTVLPLAVDALELAQSGSGGFDDRPLVHGTVTLNGPAPPGGAVVALSSSDANLAAVPATVTVPAGDSTGRFTFYSRVAATPAPVTVSASLNGVTKRVTLTAGPAVLSALQLSRYSLTAGASVSGEVLLTGKAPTGGVTVNLASSNSSVASVPATVTVKAGESYAVFPIAAQAVPAPTPVTITASSGGAVVTARLTVIRLAVATLELPSSTPIAGGTSVTGAVTLNGPAPSGGVAVALSSSGSAASVPASVTVTAGATQAEFTVATQTVAQATPVTITAALTSASKTATVTVVPTAIETLKLDPATAPGGTGATGTVMLSGPAPAGGAVVALSAGSSDAATVPASVTVAAGSKTATFPVGTARTPANTPVVITATYGGASAHAALTVLASARHDRLVVYRPSTREWYLRGDDGLPIVVEFGGPGDQPVPAPYFGTGAAQIGVFRPSTQQWFLRRDDGSAVTLPYGIVGDEPVPGDYLGLRRAQITVFRPSTRQWLIRNDSGGTVGPTSFGGPGDLPLAADYLGLKRTQMAVYRPATGEWSIRTDRGGAVSARFGGPGDQPVPADYSGLGRVQIAVYRSETGEWFLRHDNGTASVIQFGGPGDVPRPGDYSGMGRAQIAVYRPTTGEWFIRGDSGAATVIAWGAPGDRPVPAAFAPRFGK